MDRGERAPDLVPGRRDARLRSRSAPLPARRAGLDPPLLRATRTPCGERSRRRRLRPARLRRLGPTGRDRVEPAGLPRRARGPARAAGARSRPPARHLVGRNAGTRARALRLWGPDEPRPQLDPRERRRVGDRGQAPPRRAAAGGPRHPRAARARRRLRQPGVSTSRGRLRRAPLLPRRQPPSQARADAAQAWARELPGDVGTERVDAHRRASGLGRASSAARARAARARPPRPLRPLDGGDRRDPRTRPTDAREVVFEHSSHTPVLEETERYLDVVRSFLREVEEA